MSTTKASKHVFACSPSLEAEYGKERVIFLILQLFVYFLLEVTNLRSALARNLTGFPLRLSSRITSCLSNLLLYFTSGLIDFPLQAINLTLSTKIFFISLFVVHVYFSSLSYVNKDEPSCQLLPLAGKSSRFSYKHSLNLGSVYTLMVHV